MDGSRQDSTVQHTHRRPPHRRVQTQQLGSDAGAGGGEEGLRLHGISSDGAC